HQALGRVARPVADCVDLVADRGLVLVEARTRGGCRWCQIDAPDFALDIDLYGRMRIGEAHGDDRALKLAEAVFGPCPAMVGECGSGGREPESGTECSGAHAMEECHRGLPFWRSAIT